MTTNSNGQVAVLYPHPGEVSWTFHHSMVRMRQHDEQSGDGLLYGEITMRSGVDIVKARNDLIVQFLKTDCPWALFIDADMEWAPDSLFQMVKSAEFAKAKVVGGLCCIVTSEGVIPTLFVDDENTTLRVLTDNYPRDAMMEVAATGAAFLLIHRSVIEDVQRAGNGSPYAWFTAGSAIGDDGVYRWLGEDTSFCLKARLCGHRVFVNTAVEVGHFKGLRTYYAHEIFDGHHIRAEVEPPKIPTAVVVPVKNKWDLTRALIDNLAAMRDEWDRLVIVDNGSDDGTWTQICRLRDESDDIGILHRGGAGIHTMWNDGAEHAKNFLGPCNVVFLNNDITLEPGAITAMTQALAWNVYASCPVYDDRPRVAHKLETMQEICAGRYDGTGGFAGFAFAVRHDWLANWRFPEACTWWYGDNWLLLDIMAAGGRAVMAHDGKVKHLDGGSQTGGSWASPEMKVILEADRVAFMAHVEDVQRSDTSSAPAGMEQPSYADLYALVCRTPSDIYEHLPTLFDLVLALDASYVIELGTRSGVSTVALLHALDQTNGNLVSVDIDPAPQLPPHERWEFIQGDDVDFRLVGQLPEDADMVFIDTSHEYAHTVEEIQRYSELVRDGGYLVFHDSNVAKFDHHTTEQPAYPVRSAIVDMVAVNEKLSIEREYTNCNGLTLVKVQW